MMADVRRCPSCGAKHRDFRTRCLRCGTPLETQAAAGPAGWSPRVLGVAAGAVVLTAGLAWSFSGGAGVARVLPGSKAPALAVADRATRTTGIASMPAVGAPAIDPTPAASAAYQRGDYAGALLGYQRAMAEHPDDAAAVNNVGQVLVRLGRAPEAIPLFEKAASARPGDWSYRFNLARARAQVRDWPAAVADYREADRLFPDDPPTLFNLGLALQQTGADAEAATVLERAAAASPDDAAFVLALARSYQRLSRVADARAQFERYLELAPQSPDAAAARQAIAALTGAPATPPAAIPAATQAAAAPVPQG